MEKERGVILEEMSMYQDAPEDAIIDDFDAVVFGDHPLGINILGTRESVSGFQTADFHAFLQEQVRTDRLVFSSVSNLPFKEVKRLADKFLAPLPARLGPRARRPFGGYERKTAPKRGPSRRPTAWWAARPTRSPTRGAFRFSCSTTSWAARA